MAENKLELMGKIDETEVKRLHSQNDDLRDQLRKAKCKEYEDTLENLQREIDFYEKENYDLQNHQLQTVNVATDHPKMQALFLPFQPADSSPPTSQQFDETFYNIHERELIAFVCRNCLICETKIEASERMQLLDAMKPLMIPSDISGPLTLLSAQNSKKHEHDELCKRAESILTESRFYQIPYVVDISQPKSKQNLEKRKHLGNIAYINQQINDVGILDSDLKIDILRFWNRYRDGEELPSLFQNIGSVSSKNYKKEERTAETHRLKGMHSAAYKNAFESIFNNLNVKQKRTGSAEIAVSSQGVISNISQIPPMFYNGLICSGLYGLGGGSDFSIKQQAVKTQYHPDKIQ
ncbi:hypothetical protein DINM_004451 [Dirofilaria immitis]|nr:hypothetical protein [Dirofilaria immitis]